VGTRRPGARARIFWASTVLMANTTVSGIAATPAPVRVVDPGLGQIQLPVDQRAPLPGGVGQEHPEQFSTRPAVLGYWRCTPADYECPVALPWHQNCARGRRGRSRAGGDRRVGDTTPTGTVGALFGCRGQHSNIGSGQVECAGRLSKGSTACSRSCRPRCPPSPAVSGDVSAASLALPECAATSTTRLRPHSPVTHS
jgi:hypothetical protein